MNTFFRIRLTYVDQEEIFGIYGSLQAALYMAFDCRDLVLELRAVQGRVTALHVDEFTLVYTDINKADIQIIRSWSEELEIR